MMYLAFLRYVLPLLVRFIWNCLHVNFAILKYYVNKPLSYELHRKKMTCKKTFLWLSNKVTWKISGEFVSCVIMSSWCLLYVCVTWTVRFIIWCSVFYKDLCFIFCKELCIYTFLCLCSGTGEDHSDHRFHRSSSGGRRDRSPCGDCSLINDR